jgi:hypothetical protein
MRAALLACIGMTALASMGGCGGEAGSSGDGSNASDAATRDASGADSDDVSNGNAQGGFEFDTGAGKDTSASVGAGVIPNSGAMETMVPIPEVGLVDASLLSDGDGSPPLGLVAGWYAFGDGYGASGLPGSCELGGFMPSQCSSITFPVPIVTDAGVVVGPIAPGGPDGGNPGAMCLSGTAAQVDLTEPGTNIYGIGIGLDLAAPGGGPYDAPAHNVVGFSFTITGVPQGMGDIVVQFPTTGTAHFYPYHLDVGADGTYAVLFADLVAAANMVPGPCVSSCPPTPPPFDTDRLLSLRFLVTSNPHAAVPVSDMCVSGLSAIVSD